MIRTILFSLLLFYAAASAQIPYGKEFQVNTYWIGSQYLPDVAGLPDGGFVVCWQSENDGGASQDGSRRAGIYAQRYDAKGKSVAGEFRVNSRTTWDQYLSSVAGLSDGGFVVCWGL